MSKTVTKNLEAFTLKNLLENGRTVIGLPKIGILLIFRLFFKINPHCVFCHRFHRLVAMETGRISE